MKCQNCEKLQAQLDQAYDVLSHNMKIANNNTKRVRAERDLIIRKLREKHSCIEIAEQFGLTRQRVHQILNEAPVEAP
jgi:DNA-directed RNA polymerase sigma subunit (sigma70/sigma32)